MARKIHLKDTHKYYTQCQLQMHVTKVQKCFFVVWTSHRVLIDEIIYDWVFCADLLECISNCYKHFLAFKFGHWFLYISIYLNIMFTFSNRKCHWERICYILIVISLKFIFSSLSEQSLPCFANIVTSGVSICWGGFSIK